MSVEENLAMLKKDVQSVNDRDFAAFESSLTDDFVHHGLVKLFSIFGEDLHGPPATTAALEQFIHAFPDMHIHVVQLFATETQGVVQAIVTGTHHGRFLGLIPTKKKIKVSEINIYRFNNGKIAEVWQLMDATGFLLPTGRLAEVVPSQN